MCFASLCFIAFILPPIRERRDRGTTTREKNIKQRERERCNIQNLSSTFSSWWLAIVNLEVEISALLKTTLVHLGRFQSISIYFSPFGQFRPLPSILVHLSPLRSIPFISVQFSLLLSIWSISVPSGPLRSFWSTLIRKVQFGLFSPFDPIRFTSMILWIKGLCKKRRWFINNYVTFSM